MAAATTSFNATRVVQKQNQEVVGRQGAAPPTVSRDVRRVDAASDAPARVVDGGGDVLVLRGASRYEGVQYGAYREVACRAQGVVSFSLYKNNRAFRLDRLPGLDDVRQFSEYIALQVERQL